MTIPLDRLAALCPPELRSELILMTEKQRSTLRRHIRQALADARRRPHGRPGRPITSTHPRARYWREYKRRKAKETPPAASPASCQRATSA